MLQSKSPNSLEVIKFHTIANTYAFCWSIFLVQLRNTTTQREKDRLTEVITEDVAKILNVSRGEIISYIITINW